MEIDKLATTRIFCYKNRDSYGRRVPCFNAGVPAVAGRLYFFSGVATFSGVSAFPVFFAVARVSNVDGVPVVTGF
jgi:hypothetical protein